MPIANTRSTLIVAALALAVFALQVSTAEAARKGRRAARDAAIEMCLDKARAEAPNANPEGSHHRRGDIYRDCMVSAGFRP